MNFLRFIIYTLGVLICLSIQDDTHSERVFDKSTSDQEHYEGEEHNPDFDHDSFLGKDQAKEFDNLPKEESMRRLGLIFDKIDVDSNGQLSEDELRTWIVNVQNRYVIEDTRKQWTTNEYGDFTSSVKWSDYLSKHYGDSQLDEDSKSIVERDQRKWKLADRNNDNELNIEEMTGFMHPEEVKHMQDNVVLETMEDMDNNKDGKIDIDEFISDMWTKSEGNETPPEWVETERESFRISLDKNKDGFMDIVELKEWVLPGDFDHSESETKHLIDQADTNRDGVLSKEEVLDNHSVFAGNHVTDYGELLKHDEF